MVPESEDTEKDIELVTEIIESTLAIDEAVVDDALVVGEVAETVDVDAVTEAVELTSAIVEVVAGDPLMFNVCPGASRITSQSDSDQGPPHIVAESPAHVCVQVVAEVL